MYLTKPSGFRENINDMMIEAQIYQPTPAGARALCQYYNQKYHINMQVLTIDNLANPCQEIARFEFLKQSPLFLAYQEPGYHGIILMHKQQHAVSIIMSKQANKLHIIIFDSTSGSCIKTYFKVANLFPDAMVYLNNGTRQADLTSCITDAVCILKDALQLPQLNELIHSRIVSDNIITPPTPKSRLKIQPMAKPANFFIFNMPEFLLKTAQRSAYVHQANANVSTIIKPSKGYSLADYRNKYAINVSLLTTQAPQASTISSYLFFKSHQHKKLLDNSALLEHLQLSSQL